MAAALGIGSWKAAGVGTLAGDGAHFEVVASKQPGLRLTTE